jgi:anti-sigma factor RsiW
MHRQIRDKLEDYLRGDAQRSNDIGSKDLGSGGDPQGSRAGSRLPAEFYAHLGECAECAGELRSLEAQSQLLRSLRSPGSLEPSAGFYARVMERIEAQPASIWSILLQPRVGFRLAVASAALVALLGAYLVTSEPSGPEFPSSASVVFTDTPQATEASMQAEDGPRQQQQRDAVLVDLASYHQ